MTADPARLAAIHAACFDTPRPWSVEEFTAMLAAPGILLVTEPEGFLIGRALAGEAEILTLAVAPAARRAGVAARLLTAFLERAAGAGAARAFLEVAERNAPARALYARAGFVETGRRPRYYRHPDGSRSDALVLARALP